MKLAVQPLDMRDDMEAALARVVNAFGEARPHQAYLFRRARRIEVLMVDAHRSHERRRSDALRSA